MKIKLEGFATFKNYDWTFEVSVTGERDFALNRFFSVFYQNDSHAQ